VARQLYDAWGNIRASASRGTMPTDIGYTGQRLDSYIKLVQMGARWYSPELSRWLSPDTIVPDPSNPQSLNRFGYGLNNPVKYIDSGGHFPFIPLLIAGGILLFKAIDYGWTAHDAYQSGQTLADPNSSIEPDLKQASILP
jgi:RHS repeat-associated protein